MLVNLVWLGKCLKTKRSIDHCFSTKFLSMNLMSKRIEIDEYKNIRLKKSDLLIAIVVREEK